jgi:CheY-like chemotaxis protein
LAKGIEMEVFVDEPAPFMVGDADRLQQVLWNILSNAIKFTPKGGKVDLRLEQDDSHLRILVKDSGIGIEPAFLPFVFDRFRQADTGTTRRSGGLGLGLAVARYIVEAHGGTISAESAGPGFGAIFIVSFPLSRPDEQADRELAAKNKPLLEGYRILVVDDERDTGELFKFVLEEAGAIVAVASAADEALTILPSRSFDLVLADIGMPGKDGYAFIEAVRAHSLPEVRNVIVIAVTSYTAEHFRTQAGTAGFDDFITKPVPPAQLTKFVADRLTGRAK